MWCSYHSPSLFSIFSIFLINGFGSWNCSGTVIKKWVFYKGWCDEWVEAAVERLMDLLQLFILFIHVLIMMCYHLLMKYMLFTIRGGIWIKFTSKSSVLYKDFLLGCILITILNVMLLFEFWICDCIYLRMYTLFTRKTSFFFTCLYQVKEFKY